MSAFVVDARTIDYLVSWIQRKSSGQCWTRTDKKWASLAEIPENVRCAAVGNEAFGYYLNPAAIAPDTLGRILLAENVRSVQYRYEDCAPDDLPGPVDQRRMWRYSFRRVTPKALKPAWVIQAADCLSYQSCEHPEWKESLARSLVDAIREDAIDEIKDGAPWEITDDVLAGAQ